MNLSRAAKLYQERAGLIATDRGPVPRLALGLNPLFAVPVAAPLPNPQFLRDTEGAPPPDRGLTTVWPGGLDGETPP